VPKLLVLLALIAVGLIVWFLLLPELRKADFPDNDPQLPRRTFEMPNPFDE
jgi:hypothetical protein